MFTKVFSVKQYIRRVVLNSIFSILLTLVLLLNMLSFATPVQAAFTFPLTETFKGSSAPGWVLGGTAILTSGNADPTDDGWLRLTSLSTYQTGYAYYNTDIPTTRGLIITFDYGAWGGSGADGLTFFLFDGATTTFNIGASGGSLGYAQKTGFNGLSGGYLGLGLDEFGNYSKPTEGRVGGPGYTPQALAIRGPGEGTTGYAYLTGTTRITDSPFSLPRLDCPRDFTGFTNIGVTSGYCGTYSSPRPEEATYYRQVQITLTPVGSAYQVTVAMKFGPSDVYRTLIESFTMPTSAPSTLKMGFAGSTGGVTNYHEIRNLTATEQVPDLTATKAVQNATTGAGSVLPGEQLLYSVQLYNHTSTTINDVQFTDSIPTNTTYVPGSATFPTGSTLNSTSPTLDVTGISVPANGQAMVTFKVQVDNPLPAGVTQISNQGSFTYNSITSQTDGDAVNEGNQATTIEVTAGANFDNSTKTVTYEDVDGSGAVSPQDILTYHVVLSNTGDMDSPTTTFSDVLPTNTTYVAGSATVVSGGGTIAYTTITRTIDWTTENVIAGSQVTLEFKVTVNDGVQIRDVILNQGTITYDTTNVMTDADLLTPGKQPTELLVGGIATLSATKTATVVGGGEPQLGSQLLYTILLSNTGSYAVSGVTFTDTIPTYTTYVSSDTDTGAVSFSSPTLSVTGINLASGSIATIHLTVQIDSSLPSGSIQILNQGTVFWDSNQSGTNNTSLLTDSDSETAGQQPTVVTVTGSPQGLAIKSVTDENGGNLLPGDILLYTVVMQNESGYDALGLQFLDSIPANTTYVAASVIAPSGSTVVSETPMLDITGIDVPANGQVSLSFRVQLDNPLDAGVTQISNQGIVWYDSDGNGSNDASQQTDGDTTQSGYQATILPVTAGANFNETTKSVVLQNDADNSGVASPGDTLRYTILITNTGDQNASGVSFLDPVPITTTYVADSVSATSGIATYSAGSIGWTGDVNAGGSVTITYDTTINSGIITGTVISNQGTVTYDNETISTDGNASEPGDQPTQVTTGGSPQGIAVKSVTDENGGDLLPGDILLYTVVMQNQGGYDALGLQFLDSMPDNTTYVAASVIAPSGSTVVSQSPVLNITGIDVPAYGQVSLSFRVQLNNPLDAGVTQISNQGIVWYDSDGNGTNDASQQTDGDTGQSGNQATILPVTAVLDLSIIKTGRPDSVLIGSNITYNLAVRNTGAIPAESLVVIDTLPDGVTFVSATGTGWTCAQNSGVVTCERPTLAVGAEADITVVVTVDETAVSPITNHVTIASNTSENYITNNSSDAVSTLLRGNFGHLPSAYLGMNLLADGGAWAVSGDTYLGQTVSTTATDGINEENYVEKATDDGVTWTGDDWVARTGTADVEVTCPSGPCYLYAWADWNQNKQFTVDGTPEADELIYSGSVVNGINQITFNFPINNIPPGIYYTRFRVYANQPDNPQPDGGALTSDGVPIVGEIEDPTKMVYGPLVVLISGFEVTADQDGSLVIRWETTMETDLLYFNLLRSNAPEGDYLRINPEFIFAQAPGSIMGTTYLLKDSTAAPGVPSYYTLEMVLLSGASTFFGPISGVPVSNGYFYFLPLVIVH